MGGVPSQVLVLYWPVLRALSVTSWVLGVQVRHLSRFRQLSTLHFLPPV